MLTLMYAHANYVKLAKSDEYTHLRIEKLESEKDIADKTIEQKKAIIENLNYQEVLQEEIDDSQRDLSI